MATDRVAETQVIRADRDAIMKLITDFESYPDWQEEIEEAEVVERDGQGQPSQVRYVFKGQMLSANYTLAYEYQDDGISWTLVEGDIIAKMEGSYTLKDQGDGTTEVTYELEATPAIRVPKMLRRQGAKRMIESVFGGLKAKLEMD